MTPATNNQPPAANNQPPETWMAYVTNRWSRTVVQPLLVTVMLLAFITGLLILMQQILPELPWPALTYVLFLFILETVYTTLWLQKPSQRPLSHMAYRAAEFIVFILLTRLVTWALAGNWPDRAAWETILFDPLLIFADSFFLVALMAVFIVWQMAIQFTDLFSQLALDQAEAAYYADVFGAHKLDTRPNITDRGRLIAAFMQRWLIGGFVLVVCAALVTFDWGTTTTGRSLWNIARLALPQSMVLALVFYFLAGFLLLSQGRLAMMNARWLINGVQKNERLERSWYRFSLRLMVIIAFVAALLPLGSTIALGRIVAALVQGVTAVITFIFGLFVGLLSLLFPASEQAAEMATPPPIEPLAMGTPPPTTEASETLKMITSSAFWAVAIVFSVIAVLFFLRERKIKLDGNTWRQWWTAVAQWWRKLWQTLSQQVNTARQAIQSRRARPVNDKSPRSLPNWRFIRVNALSPRDQLRYFYLSTVERAGQRGVNRQESETPLEYARDLKENWPESEIDVEKLTDAFLQARYSPQIIETQQVSPVKEHWKRLRARLRRRK